MSVSYMSICPKCASFKMNSVCKYCNTQRVKTNTTFEEAMQLSEKQMKNPPLLIMCQIIDLNARPVNQQISRKYLLQAE